MFIKNLATKVIMEIHNADAIKTLSKDAGYKVAETVEGLEGEAPEAHTEPQGANSEGEGEETITGEENKAPEGTEEGTMNPPEGENHEEPQQNASTTEVPDAQLEDLQKMKVEELRKLASDKGIKGYSNMNKDTLIALIMDL